MDESREPDLFTAFEPRPNASPRGLPDGLLIAVAGPENVMGIALLSWQREGGRHAEARQRANRWLELPAESHRLFVARIDAAVLGYGRVTYVRPSLQPPDDRPEGWHLSGVIVDEGHRRRGIGTALTRHRLDWIAERAAEACYFANSLNRASIDLHRRLGFEQIAQNIRVPGCSFSGGGIGLLFRISLEQAQKKRLTFITSAAGYGVPTRGPTGVGGSVCAGKISEATKFVSKLNCLVFIGTKHVPLVQIT